MRRRAARHAVVAFATLVLAVPSAPSTAAPPPAPSRLLVTATEYRFALSRGVLPAGPAVVQLSDRGQDPHDLVVRRLDRRGRQVGHAPAAAPRALPGTVLERAYRLTPGRYVLFCSLPGHRRAGMQARITVRR